MIQRKIGADMSDVRENTMALIERYYAAFNAMDIEAILACLTDDVAHDINQGARETGKDAFRAFLGRMDHAYSEQLRDIVIMTSTDGTRAAAEFMVHGIYKVADDGFPPAHGQSYVLPAGGFFDITDGQIARVSVYYNLTDWIAQVS
jgi:steroid delta-isomerase-like uncharacterized protein